MNKQEIEQLYFIELEINLLEEQIKSVLKEEKVCPVLIDDDKREAFNGIIDDYRKMIVKSLENLYHKRNLIEKYIESVDNSELRIILRLRYIHFYSWGNIAYKIKAKGESTPRMKVNKFFDDNLTWQKVINITLTDRQTKHLNRISQELNKTTAELISDSIDKYIEAKCKKLYFNK